MSTPDIGEQALSKAVEIGLESQLDKVDNLDVDIRADPLELAQGKLESVIVDGKGMVMKKELRAERVILQTDSINIDPLKAALGKIKLETSTNAETKIVLLESDLQQAFNSEYIKDKLKNQKVNLDGETVTVNASNVKFALPGEGKISLKAELEIVESQQTKQIALLAKPTINEQGNKIVIEDVEYPDGENTDPQLTDALLRSTEELLDLRNFELGKMTLHIDRLDIGQGKMTMAARTTIQEFPNS
ncbi:LmeA family phospholipid-binding protein [Pleurocapsa sp. FMAR1]|uniref:LmeA family phospholipid-binding protein n=1 Tax=Pleurocapsa sp. FMAR1 TaxID=3040204 RepID=UPI0029C97F0E|nr:DUF2993 domain-containing protein [Pleurocapsa sp. FMAR1]